LRVILHGLFEKFPLMNDNLTDQEVSERKTLSWEEAVLWLKAQPNQEDLIKACFYDDPLQSAAERYYQSTEWLALREELPQVGRVLDIGSGRGISAYAFAKDGWQVDALEPNGSSVVGAGAIRALAKDGNLAITVEQTWGEKLPYADKTFDVVHGRQVLHHAHDLAKLCAEAARVLKPNGIFIATREHVISRHEDLPKFLSSHPLHKLYGGEHAYLLKEYKQAIVAGGIRLKKALNPYASDINLYPETQATIKHLIKHKLRIPDLLPIPDLLLTIAAEFNDAPGRLYTFVGVKHA
jgi:SAM-dependent methyltransferase